MEKLRDKLDPLIKILSRWLPYHHMSGNAHGYKYNTITIVDEKISRPDSAGCQEESDQPKREVIWCFQTLDQSMNIEHLLTYQCYGGQEEVRPTKEGEMWLPPTVAQLVVLLVDLQHHTRWVRPALVVIPNREGSKQISKPVPN